MVVDPKPSCANSVGHWDLVERHGVLNGKGRKQLHCDCESTEAWGKQNRNKYRWIESWKKTSSCALASKRLTKKLNNNNNNKKLKSHQFISNQNKTRSKKFDTHYQLISSDSLFFPAFAPTVWISFFQGPWPVVLTQFSGLGSVDWCFLGDTCNVGNLRPPTLEPMSEIFKVIFSSPIVRKVNCLLLEFEMWELWVVNFPRCFQNTRCSLFCPYLVKLHGSSTVIHCNEAQCSMIKNAPRLNRPEISSPSPQT